MHELALTQDLVAVVAENCAGNQVKRVVLEIGKLSAVLPDAMRFCFDVCAKGTVVEGAALEIVELPGRGRCRACGAEIELDHPLGRCTCGATDLEWIAGQELRLREVEVV